MNLSLTIPPSTKTPVVFSLPKTNSYQTIEKGSYPHSQLTQTITDDTFKNTIFISEAPAKKVLTFVYTPKKYTVSLEDLFTLDSYTSKQSKRVRNDSYISGTDPAIQKIADKLFYDETHIKSILETAYQYTLDTLTYGNPTKRLYSYSDVLKKSVTDCGGFSTFLCSLIQSKGIPTRLVVGYVRKKNRRKTILSKLIKKTYTFDDFSMHAWMEALLPNDIWFPMDPSVEWRRTHMLSTRPGGFGIIPPDRLVVSFGQDISFYFNNTGYRVDILQDPQTL